MSLRIAVPTDDLLERLSDLDVEIVTWDGSGAQPDGNLDMLVWPYTVSAARLADLDVSRIGLVQAQSLGYDGVAEALPAGGVYANAIDVHEASTAELAMALILAAQRNLDLHVRRQVESSWKAKWAPGLIDRSVLLVGVGGIGSELLPRLAGFGADVVRVGTTARDDEHGHVHATTELPELLPSADVVVVAVPLTEATTHLVDTAFLAAMADGALLVNVARGKVVDTAAVLAEEGRVRYASDVFETEPLPADHPIWTAPGVMVTPHVGGMSQTMPTRVEGLLRRQIARLEAGQDPDHVVVRA